MRHFFVRLAGGIVCVCSAASAATFNGYEWEHGYAGADLPLTSSSEWALTMNAGGSVAHTPGTSITLTSPPSLGGATGYEEVGGNWAPGASGTAWLEFGIQVNQIQDGVSDATMLNIAEGAGGGGIAFLLGASGVHYYGNGTILAAIDITEYHVYRLSLTPATQTFSLWVDGTNYVNEATLWAGSSPNYLGFGDFGGGVGGEVVYDYIAWNNSGAPTPVPEPVGAMIWLGAAGLAARARIRV